MPTSSNGTSTRAPLSAALLHGYLFSFHSPCGMKLLGLFVAKWSGIKFMKLSFVKLVSLCAGSSEEGLPMLVTSVALGHACCLPLEAKDASSRSAHLSPCVRRPPNPILILLDGLFVPSALCRGGNLLLPFRTRRWSALFTTHLCSVWPQQSRLA